MAGTAVTRAIDGTPTNGANPWLDSLVWGGRWVSASGAAGPTVISYATQSGEDPYDILAGDEAAYAWSTSDLIALETAQAAWESVAAIDFQLVDADAADVWFWKSTATQAEGALGWSDVPASTFDLGEPLYLVVNGDVEAWSDSSIAVGSFDYITPLHEIGHLLGLAHPHDGGDAEDANTFPGVEAPFDEYGLYGLNQGIWTTLTYNDGWAELKSDTHDYGWQATPMALDVAAIQSIYGANLSYKTGNDVYRLPVSNTVGTYWSCIWDAGGVDTISNSGSSKGCIIDLNAAPLAGPDAGGYVSYINDEAGAVIGGFTVANKVVIENATGGSGRDHLIGNAVANTLDGGLGNDVMVGHAGNDTYHVRDSGDVILEAAGEGRDTVYSHLAKYTLTSNLESGRIMSAGNADLTGNGLNNVIHAGKGNNVLVGGSGTDTLSYAYGVSGTAGVKVSLAMTSAQTTGGSGTDKLSGFERLTGSANSDRLTGNRDANLIRGGNGNDTVIGGSGNDTLYGDAGNDLLRGGAGNDLLYGGIGKDVFRFDTALGTSTTPNIDTIKDFSVLDDTIQLENAIFTRFGTTTTGAIDPAFFRSNTTGLAQDSNDYIIYETDTGKIFYDADGSGAGGSVQIALVGTQLALTAADFVLV